jgi:hypothetical protein
MRFDRFIGGVRGWRFKRAGFAGNGSGVIASC